SRQRRQEERRQRQASSGSDFGDGDMSAMAMAFAQAGASELIAGTDRPENEDEETGQSPSAAGDQAGAEEQPADLDSGTTAQELAGDTEVENPVGEGEKITDAGSEADKTIVEEGSAGDGDVVPNPATEET